MKKPIALGDLQGSTITHLRVYENGLVVGVGTSPGSPPRQITVEIGNIKDVLRRNRGNLQGSSIGDKNFEEMLSRMGEGDRVLDFNGSAADVLKKSEPLQLLAAACGDSAGQAAKATTNSEKLLVWQELQQELLAKRRPGMSQSDQARLVADTLSARKALGTNQVSFDEVIELNRIRSMDSTNTMTWKEAAALRKELLAKPQLRMSPDDQARLAADTLSARKALGNNQVSFDEVIELNRIRAMDSSNTMTWKESAALQKVLAPDGPVSDLSGRQAIEMARKILRIQQDCGVPLAKARALAEKLGPTDMHLSKTLLEVQSKVSPKGGLPAGMSWSDQLALARDLYECRNGTSSRGKLASQPSAQTLYELGKSAKEFDNLYGKLTSWDDAAKILQLKNTLGLQNNVEAWKAFRLQSEFPGISTGEIKNLLAHTPNAGSDFTNLVAKMKALKGSPGLATATEAWKGALLMDACPLLDPAHLPEILSSKKFKGPLADFSKVMTELNNLVPELKTQAGILGFSLTDEGARRGAIWMLAKEIGDAADGVFHALEALPV